LHLEAIKECFPIFAASGHHNYLKTAYLYLQNMLELPVKNPKVYNVFKNGFHVVRRSDRNWTLLGADLVIEQVLMRFLKTRSGLTREIGFSEVQRAT
jgi:hypothetical protein